MRGELSRFSRFRSISSPVVLEAVMENELNGTLADIDEAVGVIVQIAPTPQSAIGVGISFSIVRDGFAKVNAIDV